MGWSITFTRVVIPQFLLNPVTWIRKNMKLQKQNSWVCNPPALFAVQNHHGPLPCTWCPKKMDPDDLGDYRCLNLVTTPYRYPLPNMQDLSNGLHGCNIFTKIDLVKGYHQKIPVAAKHIPKTAIITPFGLFEYLFMPFGLSNTAQTF
jgi:hypothetical protein